MQVKEIPYSSLPLEDQALLDTLVSSDNPETILETLDSAHELDETGEFVDELLSRYYS